MIPVYRVFDVTTTWAALHRAAIEKRGRMQRLDLRSSRGRWSKLWKLCDAGNSLDFACRTFRDATPLMKLLDIEGVKHLFHPD